jgi:A/G-specific adenine glycosylase
VREHCRTRDPESLPVKKPRRKTIALAENCAWIVHDGRLLLEHQTGPRWRGLWKLPVLETPPTSPHHKLLLAFDYPFTHHRVTLSVFTGKPPKPSDIPPTQSWHSLDQIDTIALAAPHRRAIKRLTAER